MSFYYWLVGHRTRVTYWSSSAFADYIRSRTKVTKKPNSATTEGWNAWHKENKAKIGYWIAEELLNNIQDAVYFVPDVYHRIRVYVRNRYIDKPHYLDTKLEKGVWHEFDTRVLHGLFETLVDFVEIEKAHMFQITNELKKEKEPRSCWYCFGRGRKGKKLPSREDGLAYLDWEIGLGDESPLQAEAAQKTKDLYLWWTEVRPNRPDPYKESGWDAFYEDRKGDNADDVPWFRMEKTEEDKQRSRDISLKIDEIEQRYDDEDTEKLIQIVNLRKSLWT